MQLLFSDEESLPFVVLLLLLLLLELVCGPPLPPADEDDDTDVSLVDDPSRFGGMTGLFGGIGGGTPRGILPPAFFPDGLLAVPLMPLPNLRAALGGLIVAMFPAC